MISAALEFRKVSATLKEKNSISSITSSIPQLTFIVQSRQQLFSPNHFFLGQFARDWKRVVSLVEVHAVIYQRLISTFLCGIDLLTTGQNCEGPPIAGMRLAIGIATATPEQRRKVEWWSRKLPQKVPEREWREGESGVKLKQKMVGNFSPPCRWQSLSLEDGEARGARKPAKFHPSSLLPS